MRSATQSHQGICLTKTLTKIAKSFHHHAPSPTSRRCCTFASSVDSQKHTNAPYGMLWLSKQHLMTRPWDLTLSYMRTTQVYLQVFNWLHSMICCWTIPTRFYGECMSSFSIYRAFASCIGNILVKTVQIPHLPTPAQHALMQLYSYWNISPIFILPVNQEVDSRSIRLCSLLWLNITFFLRRWSFA